MGQTTLVVIIVGSLVGFALLVILILAFTLTPERAEALGTVFSGLTRLVQGIRGKKGEEDGDRKREREERRDEMERGFASGALAAIATILPQTRTESRADGNASTVSKETEPVIRNKGSAGNAKTSTVTNDVQPKNEEYRSIPDVRTKRSVQTQQL